MNIKISEKHGVNPSLEICFYCGESIGVALLGKLPNDEKAPNKIVTSYTPCDKCKETFSKGVLVLEYITVPTGYPTIRPDIYPTGRFAGITKEAAKRIFNSEKPTILISKEIFDNIFNTSEENYNEQ